MKSAHQPDYAFHPGETLAETLEELGMTQKDLAERAGRPLKTINEIEQLRALLGFFGVAGIEEWQQLWERPEVAFRKSTAFDAHPMAVAAWLRQGERLAQSVATQPFDKDRFIAAMREIRTLTTAKPEVFEPAMKRLCAGAGVAVVFVPEVAFIQLNGLKRRFSLNETK